MSLPCVIDRGGDIHVLDKSTGELVDLRSASDHTLASAAREVAELDKQLREARRALAFELRDRYGVGTVHAGGHSLVVKENTSWPAGATREALARLVAQGHISQADAKRAMPEKPSPDARQLGALSRRLALHNPDAARILIEACTTSPPSVADVRVEAVEEPEAA